MSDSSKKYVTMLVLAAILAGGWFALRPVFKSVVNALGTTAEEIEAWCGEQILAIANTYLGPELSFDGLSYSAPEALRVTNIALVDGDVTILEASSLDIALAEVPRPGQPIVIEQITLIDPVIRLVRDEASGGFVGFSTLVESGAGAVSEDGGSTRLSDVFAIRLLQVENGGFEFDDGSGPVQSMHGMTFTLRGEPEVDAPGWYGMHVNAGHPEMTSIGLDGRVNLDDLVADIRMLTLSAFVRDDTRSIFPPSIQSMLVEHDVIGQLNVEASGHLDLQNPAANLINASLNMSDTGASVEAFRIPIDSLNATVRLEDEVVHIEPLAVETLDGTMEVTGTIDESGGGFADLALAVDGMKIQSLYREATDNPKLAGSIKFDATVTALMQSLRDSLRGQGELHITEGRLVHLPVIEDVAELVGAVLGTSGSMSDTAQSTLTFLGDRVELTEFRVLSSAVAVRGGGSILTDGTLDLEVNAGVLERAQEALGVLGDLFASVTDNLSKYRIGGKVAQPEISLRPLGL